MGLGLKKDPYAPKLDYSLKRRFFDSNGEPMPWQDIAHGEYEPRNSPLKFGLKHVQQQIDLLIKCGRKVEIEFIHNKIKKDYYGYPTKKETIFNMGDDAP